MCSLHGCYNVATLHVAIPCMAILLTATLHVAHGKLHKMCMFHTTRKLGPHKHMIGIHCSFLVSLLVDMQVKNINDVVIEWYHTNI